MGSRVWVDCQFYGFYMDKTTLLTYRVPQKISSPQYTPRPLISLSSRKSIFQDMNSTHDEQISDFHAVTLKLKSKQRYRTTGTDVQSKP